MKRDWMNGTREVTASTCVLLCLLLWGVSAAWAGDGVVALQTADPSCADPTNSDRFIDCGNGTVTDNDTGLVWLKNANCIGAAGGGTGSPLGVVDWPTAMEFVAGLSDKPAGSAAAAHDCGLSDDSSPGEWRLPSVEEWEAMVAVADSLGCTQRRITNDAGNDCWDAACVTAGACSFTGVVASWYWSASLNASDPSGVWLVANYIGGPDIFWQAKSCACGYVWPVRGGQ